MRAEAAVASEEDAPTPAEAPVIMLGPLEKSCVDELSDGVQSMDVRWDGLQDVFSRLGLFLYYMLTFTSVFQKNNSCFTVFLYMCAFNKCLSALLASFPQSCISFSSCAAHENIQKVCTVERVSNEGRKIYRQGEIWHVHLQTTQAWRLLSSRSLSKHIFSSWHI